ncbi:hypothetical protein ABT369_39450 [Dactylosporangium sp. NPDC000244]|uniref:hypothetical protein n=1 Tax=Dactylosporangium sp. NPDC000244 TaxID=3154365 RepID=UPI00331D7AC4
MTEQVDSPKEVRRLRQASLRSTCPTCAEVLDEDADAMERRLAQAEAMAAGLNAAGAR